MNTEQDEIRAAATALARLSHKARWSNTTPEQRSEFMRYVRKTGITRRKLKAAENSKIIERWEKDGI